MTKRMEDQIRHFTAVLDATAPSLEALLPEPPADHVGKHAPPLLVTGTIERSGSRWRGWGVAVVTAAAVVAVIVPAWVLRPMTIDQEVGAPSTVTSEQGASPQPTTELPAAPIGSDVVMNPANGHSFQAVAAPGGITWEDARDAAASRSLEGVAGHLATFTSADEYLYVVEHLPQAFESGPDRNPYWIGGFQPAGSAEPAGGWSWVTGEPFIYAPWGSTEPNDSVSGEDCLHPHHDPDQSPAWNDQPCDDATIRGYLVEYEPTG